jgi:Flp pilus assembly pilin Flp
MTRSTFNRFLRDDSGATAIEFSIVAGMFFLLMLGVIEFGLFMMTQVAIESATTQAGRATAIGVATGGDRVAAVTSLIRQRTAGLINRDAIIISASTVATGGATVPDFCLHENGAPADSPPTCPPWVVDGQVHYFENGNNNVYNGPGTTTLGNAGDLVEVRVSYPWRVLIPFLGEFFGDHGVVLITSSTVVRNEPF